MLNISSWEYKLSRPDQHPTPSKATVRRAAPDWLLWTPRPGQTGAGPRRKAQRLWAPLSWDLECSCSYSHSLLNMAATGRTGVVWPTGCVVEELNSPEMQGPRLLTKPGYSKAPPCSSVELMRALPHIGEYLECAVWPDLVNQQEKTTWKRQIFTLT